MELRKFNNNATKTTEKQSPKASEPEIVTSLRQNSTMQVLPKLEELRKMAIKTESPAQKSIHSGHRQRLKKQFLEYGIETLTDIQKIELLLFFSIPQKDTNPIAHALLDEFKSIRNIFSAEPAELMRIPGIKENTATHIKLINNFINIVNKPSLDDVISSTAKAKEFCTKLFVGIEVEQFYVICVTKANRIKKVKMIQSGTLDEINVQIRNITAFAIETKCNRIFVCHNHPSGNAVMSDEDCAFTYSLICSCLLNSIEVLDHIIVGTDKTISLCEQKIMQYLRERSVKTIQLPKDKDLMLSSSGDEYIISEYDTDE